MVVVLQEDNFEIDTFSGLNVDARPSRIENNELAQCDNLWLNEEGELLKRWGISSFGVTAPTTGSVQVLGYYSDEPHYYAIISTSTETLYIRDDSDTPVTIMSRQSLYCTQYNDKMYFATANGIFEWTGPTGTVTPIGAGGGTVAPSDSIYVVAFKDRLWSIKNNGSYIDYALLNPDPLVPGSPPVWGSIGIEPGDGDYLVAAVPYSDRLILFKTSSIHNLYLAGPEEFWTRRLVSSHYGAVGPYAVVENRGLVYFMFFNGIYVTDGIAFTEVSKPIRVMFENRSQKIISFFDSLHWVDNRLWAVITAPDVTSWLVMRTDSTIRGWSKIVTNAVKTPSRTMFIPSRIDAGRYLFGAAEANTTGSGKLFKFLPNTYTDEGEVFTCTLRSKRFGINRDTRMKRNKYTLLFLDGVTAEPNFGYEVDGVFRLIGSVYPPAGAPYVDREASYKVEGAEYFRTLQLYLDESSASPFSIQGFNLVLMLHRQQPQKAI